MITKKGVVEPTTYVSYDLNARHIKDGIGFFLVQKLRRSDIEVFYAKLLDTLSSSSVQRVHAVLLPALNMAVRDKLIRENPLKFIKRPKSSTPPVKAFSTDMAGDNLRVASTTEYYIPILIAVFTGFRRAEIVGLTWDSFNEKTKSLTIWQPITSLGGKRAKKRAKTRASTGLL